jgi:predicted lactoylglutathione lyase
MKLLVNLFCQDIDAQLAFYQALLNLPEDVHSHSPIYRSVATEDFHFGFHAPDAYDLLSLSNRKPDMLANAPVTAYATFFLDSMDEVDRLTVKATQLGGRVVKAPYATYYGQWQSVVADPEDHVFRLSCMKSK